MQSVAWCFLPHVRGIQAKYVLRAGFIWCIENLESHGIILIYNFIFHARKVIKLMRGA